MLTEERWASILDIVEREKAVSVPELEAVLGVSASWAKTLPWKKSIP